jgi:hypothetical protein
MSDDDNTPNSTVAMPPLSPHFDHGWQAWQAVIGRLAQSDAPDARIRIEVGGRPDGVAWAAEVMWGAIIERMSEHQTLGEAFQALADELSTHHWEFNDTLTGLSHYDLDDWLDAETAESLGRVVDTVTAAFKTGWSLAFTYQPVEMADQRVQGRLVAQAGSVAVAGRGRTLIDAVRDVLRSVAPHLGAAKRS